MEFKLNKIDYSGCVVLTLEDNGRRLAIQIDERDLNDDPRILERAKETLVYRMQELRRKEMATISTFGSLVSDNFNTTLSGPIFDEAEQFKQQEMYTLQERIRREQMMQAPEWRKNIYGVFPDTKKKVFSFFRINKKIDVKEGASIPDSDPVDDLRIKVANWLKDVKLSVA